MFKRIICLITIIFFLWVPLGDTTDYTQSQTWVTDEIITATKLNVDIAGIVAILNNLDNENISAAAAIVASKLDLTTVVQNVAMTGTFKPKSVTSDPCGSDITGSIFYNSTSNYWCGCDSTNDVKLSDTAAACF